MERIEQPAERDGFELRRGRRDDDESGVLIPGGGEHVGGERCGERRADDEAEVAAAGGGAGAGRPELIELADDRCGLNRGFGKRSIELGERGDGCGGGSNASGGESFEVGCSPSGGVSEEGAGGHGVE